MKFDYLIVGQGLAGSLLHHFLQKENKKVLVVDDFKMSSSRISSGILNPLTGRRYVKSWRYDEFLEYAIPVYRQLEQLLQISLIQPLPIIRALPNRDAEIKWDERTSLPEYEKYAGEEPEWGELEGLVTKDVPFVRINEGYHFHMPRFIDAYRLRLKDKGHLIDDVFRYEDLDVNEQGIEWKGYKADHIVFCEGAGAAHNPYFDYLPFNLSKGEAMTVDVPFHLKRVVKYKSFLVPWAKDRMWVGSASFWNFEDDQPTEKGKKRVIRQFEHMYNGEYNVHEWMAAIKPGTKDRRPFLGTHPKHKRIHIYNGLGTKGASMSALFAGQMADYLIKGAPIDKSVDIIRFNDVS